MSEQDEPSGDFRDPSASPQLASSIRQLPQSSGRPFGTPYQNQLMDAVAGSEFEVSFENGVATRRAGGQLHISYDQAMEFLWPPEAD